MPFPDYPDSAAEARSPDADTRYDTMDYEADQRRDQQGRGLLDRQPGPISPDGLQMPPGGKLTWQPYSGTYAVWGPNGEYLGLQGTKDTGLRRIGEMSRGDETGPYSEHELANRGIVSRPDLRTMAEAAGGLGGGAGAMAGRGLRRATMPSPIDDIYQRPGPPTGDNIYERSRPPVGDNMMRREPPAGGRARLFSEQDAERAMNEQDIDRRSRPSLRELGR